ncbi:MAG: carboxymuconolactone decarboxylase family protein [Melioribacteraceae bacterium]|nr:carboxymuconolactone decarboxylase family protein [Melioribacteraceae bacterium]MCF8356590.1 carboxymuconolactone decarboxylase family protein [Melioribacteraceae bacterium]MCF8395971.1 carboxymuconolactone decarboxylase family protein [Melioribacteraceae bacterium]MCF8421022.1 carboxymuconolactone decarboxylase family protein [Melioribacteraceae bacterium]
MHKFTIHTLETAPEESKEMLLQSKNGAGFIPNMHAVMAESPVLLKAYKEMGKLFNKTSFTPVEREMIEMTINQVNGCTYCVSAHSYFNRLSNFPEEILKAMLEEKTLKDSKLQTLKLFTKSIIEKKGWINSDEIDTFIAAGYSNEQLLELIVGVAHKIISNYVNHIAGTPTDTQFEID